VAGAQVCAGWVDVAARGIQKRLGHHTGATGRDPYLDDGLFTQSGDAEEFMKVPDERHTVSRVQARDVFPVEKTALAEA